MLEKFLEARLSIGRKAANEKSHLAVFLVREILQSALVVRRRYL